LQEIVDLKKSAAALAVNVTNLVKFNEETFNNDPKSLQTKKTLVPLADIRSPRDGGLKIFDDNSEQHLVIDPNGAGEIYYSPGEGRGVVKITNLETNKWP